MTLSWGDWIETGVPDIDNDHRDLIRINNELIDAINHDAPTNTIRSIISAFCFVYMRHIKMEERLMADLNYDHFVSHKLHHDYFANRLIELERDDPNLLTTYDKVSAIMIEFIAVHLDKHDAPLAAFLKSQKLSDVIVNGGTDDELCKAIMSVWQTLLSHNCIEHADATKTM